MQTRRDDGRIDTEERESTPSKCSLCWDCRNVFNDTCPWIEGNMPVDGWVAEKYVGSYYDKNLVTYEVYKCPLFTPDKMTLRGMDGHTAKVFATAVVNKAYKDFTSDYKAIKKLKELPSNPHTRRTIAEKTKELQADIVPFFNGALQAWIDVFELNWYAEKFTNRIIELCEDLNLDFDVRKFISTTHKI